MTRADSNHTTIEKSLRRIMTKLPMGLRTRFENTFDHFDRSLTLYELDREMASFRAITGEEEAATALMRVVQIRKYEGADRLRPKLHHHKAAIVATVIAIRNKIYPLLSEFQLIFDFDKGRIDVRVPLSNFGVKGGKDYGLQPVEPLDLLHSRQGLHEQFVFDDALEGFASVSGSRTIKKLINEQANARNKLLYASDQGVPKSMATKDTIGQRRDRALAILVLTVMVYQTTEELAMVRQVLPAVLRVL